LRGKKRLKRNWITYPGSWVNFGFSNVYPSLLYLLNHFSTVQLMSAQHPCCLLPFTFIASHIELKFLVNPLLHNFLIQARTLARIFQGDGEWTSVVSNLENSIAEFNQALVEFGMGVEFATFDEGRCTFLFHFA